MGAKSRPNTQKTHLKRHFHEEFGEVVLFGVDTGGFGVATEEVQRQRLTQVEVERPQDVQLHLTDLQRRVGVVGDVNEVVDLGRVHLLVLGRDPHATDANQLQLLALDVAATMRKITIQDGHRQIKGLLQKTEALVNLGRSEREDYSTRLTGELNHPENRDSAMEVE